MTASVTHPFVNPKSDGGDTTITRPSDWNAGHTISGLTETPVLPSVVAVGTSATGTGDVTPVLPTGHTTNDILLLFVQSGNQAATAPAGYAKLGPNMGIGTAAAAGATRLTTFWKRDGGAESDPTVTDTGDHTLAQMMAIRGCPTSGDPFLNVGVVRKATASVTGTAYPGATPVDACLVVNAFVHALDSASAVFSSFTNADLANVTEQIDVATADGNGGGIGVCTGELAKAGNFTATTVTMTSDLNLASTFIMLPAAIVSRAGFIDRQVFLTPGSDTWAKPTGAKTLLVKAIGGGSSGSAGRNAATAAGGGGGGGGGYMEASIVASSIASGVGVTIGAGGAATANSDGAASNVGSASVFTSTVTANGGLAAGVSATGSGGVGGAGGGLGSILTPAGTFSFTAQPAAGGTGGTTALAGGYSLAMGDVASGAAGAGGGTTQAASAGGSSLVSGAGGGGGRSNTTVGTGGAGIQLGGAAGGSTAGANGADGDTERGGGGGAGGTSAAGPGGTGGWPGGGGGGGGSQSGAQRGGAGGGGVVVVTTFC